MTIQLRRPLIQATLLISLGAVGVAGGPTSAVAAVQDTDWQLPIPCGQRWTTASHSGHASRWMIDMVSAGGATAGTPVLASAAGTVSQSFYSSSGGEMIVIDHGEGWQTRYLHMSSRSVAAGDDVGQGDEIGIVGSTGQSTGAHLHFEQKLNGVVQQAHFDGNAVPLTWSYHRHYETSNNNCGEEGDDVQQD